ncbi:ABC-type nitrate/sulfonate/bicarbonate transport systems periplasmic components-like protein [Staphylothermus marinus F1]|uniref:ABC-type nitrate/sulfonate/bicarbonate transport systems periplasmic components-like protein n=1 Tax=Staphylothermus marinus (strain ATCC 43588 / DSM 3639 / JCM 9404 / F1) TaxID=399550 RepID=A3DKM4_STAMF|nr:ABC transporter substrate-binding protein [Staphylothermus marinus]ABN69184.1 ABC-type nitrate/sulfonate/bicarbonate transport systems periplasmic components-like protein [Staphylothermus marinus F1]
MITKKRILAIIIVIVVVVGSLYYLDAQASLRKNIVRLVVGVELNDHSAAFWVALDKGYFRDLGLDVEYKTFSTGLELAVALSRGDFDIALACIGPVMVMYSRGVPVILVAMTHLNGYSMIIGTKINNIHQLNGAKASVSGPGSPVWLIAHMFMEKYNVSFTLVKMPPFIAVNALLNHQVSISFLPEHYATLAVKLGGFRALTNQDLWKNMPGSGVFVKKDFLKDHRDLVEKFVYAIYRAILFIKNNPEDAAIIVAKHLASTTEVMADSMKYLDYTVEINVSAIQYYSKLLHKYGAIDHEINVDNFIDISILEDLGLMRHG